MADPITLLAAITASIAALLGVLREVRRCRAKCTRDGVEFNVNNGTPTPPKGASPEKKPEQQQV